MFSNSDMYYNSLLDIPSDFDVDATYLVLTNDPHHVYDFKRSKAIWLHDPKLEYIHHFLAFSFSGHIDASTIFSRTELFLL